MVRTSIRRGIRFGIVVAIFALGFLCGSLTQRGANAQLKQLGAEAVKQAVGSGGALGSVAKLGTTIVDMEQHVSALQKNLDVLKKVKAALGG